MYIKLLSVLTFNRFVVYNKGSNVVYSCTEKESRSRQLWSSCYALWRSHVAAVAVVTHTGLHHRLALGGGCFCYGRSVGFSGSPLPVLCVRVVKGQLFGYKVCKTEEAVRRVMDIWRQTCLLFILLVSRFFFITSDRCHLQMLQISANLSNQVFPIIWA